MNARTHSFKVYFVETVSGYKYWTLNKPTEQHQKEYGDKLLRTETLWDFLYLAREGTKRVDSQKTLVRKTDLEFVLTELAGTGGFERLSEENAQ